ncbi:hypothetical protein L211DRAFT_847031 [Terfezia boudieri ATCC MYA-4762]|uniref:Uncharacterized protein n=1 Tax=Terfezia boudieri ATCC MYA-4762 TaxID=1051890 RepID=A0A3N4LVI4_9PEZI|nr:hypothetical protein L211DRAFT_847031 [Terfezia boudieri ATCC MYA-4762]
MYKKVTSNSNKAGNMLLPLLLWWVAEGWEGICHNCGITAIELEEKSECSESDSSKSEPEALGLPSHIHLGEEIIWQGGGRYGPGWNSSKNLGFIQTSCLRVFMVFRPAGEEYHPDCVVPRRPARDTTVKVWGCFWGSYQGGFTALLEGRNNATTYLSTTS